MHNRPLNVCLITPSYRSQSRPDAVHYELNPRCRYVNFCISYSEVDASYIEQQIEAVIQQIHALKKRGLEFDIISFTRGGAGGELDIPGLFDTPFMAQAFKRLATLCDKLVIAVGHTNDRVARLEALAAQQPNIFLRDVPYAAMLFIKNQAESISQHVSKANYILGFSAKELVAAIKESSIYNFHAYVDVYQDLLEQTTGISKKVCELCTLTYYAKSDRFFVNSGELFKNCNFSELREHLNAKCGSALKSLDKNAIPNVYNLFVLGMVKNVLGDLSSFERCVTLAVADQIKEKHSSSYKIKGQYNPNTQHYLSLQEESQVHSVASEHQKLVRNAPRSSRSNNQYWNNNLNQDLQNRRQVRPLGNRFTGEEQKSSQEVFEHKLVKKAQAMSATAEHDPLDLSYTETKQQVNHSAASALHTQSTPQATASKPSRWSRMFQPVPPQPIPELSMTQIMNRGFYFVILGIVAFIVDKFF